MALGLCVALRTSLSRLSTMEMTEFGVLDRCGDNISGIWSKCESP